MVSPENRDSVPVLYLENQHIKESLHTMEAPIHIVPHEQVISILNKATNYRQLATDLENLQQVIELAMDITADSDWCPDLNHVGFFYQDLFNLC